MDKRRRIADAHAHIYPEKIADKATRSVGEFYDLAMDLPAGRPDVLITQGEKIGVTRYLVSSVATVPHQVCAINDYISLECGKHPEFVGLMAMHRDFTDFCAELDRGIAAGLAGVKFHPDFQQFLIDDPAMLPIYRAICERGLVVQFHTGDKRYPYSEPERLRRVLDALPDLKCIAAHFGGYSVWERARCLWECGAPGLYFDTSSSLFAFDAASASDVIHTAGADRFLFGSDFPMWDHVGEYARFRKLSLTEDEFSRIESGNFSRLFDVAV